jgi:hypothetical protein
MRNSAVNYYKPCSGYLALPREINLIKSGIQGSALSRILIHGEFKLGPGGSGVKRRPWRIRGLLGAMDSDFVAARMYQGAR